METKWIAIAAHKPPEEAYAVFGWWCYWPDSISWEISDDRPSCATHFCVLPAAPPYDRAALAKARGEVA